VSPSAISAVAIWYRSRDQTRWYGPDGASLPQIQGIVGEATYAPRCVLSSLAASTIAETPYRVRWAPPVSEDGAGFSPSR
jgi:hypothetical protein